MDTSKNAGLLGAAEIGREKTKSVANVKISDGPTAIANPDANGWRSDMENAPRDGSRILVCGGYRTFDSDMWDDHYPTNEAEKVFWFRGKWCSGNDEGQNCFQWVHDPTHWQPLPAPPVGEK